MQKCKSFDFAFFLQHYFSKGLYRFHLVLVYVFQLIFHFSPMSSETIKRLLALAQVVKICKTCVLIIHVCNISYLITKTKSERVLTRTVNFRKPQKKLIIANNRSTIPKNRLFLQNNDVFGRIHIMQKFRFFTFFCKTTL